jgi:hypothetical protein
MQAKTLQLVVPKDILQTYKPKQQAWLWAPRDFIGEARRRQS